MPLPTPPLFSPATPDRPAIVLVIAELGVNHDGSIDRALELVNAAAAAGADAVKLQLFDPRNLLSNQAMLAGYQKQSGSASNAFELLDRLKLSPAALAEIRQAAQHVGLKFIVTPFSLEDVPTLESLQLDAVKIASPDAVNPPLLQAAASLGKPMLLSTGACELNELIFAADLLRNHLAAGCLLQCVSCYPTNPQDAALGAIPVLAQTFNLPVGYSDHTTELVTGALAVAAGACVIEKHLTYNRNADGPDHAASLDPVTFSHYVDLVRQAALMLGPNAKHALHCETDVRSVSRQSLCAKRDLPAGHVLTKNDLTLKRPHLDSSIPAEKLDQIIGQKLAANVKANDLLKKTDVAS